MSVWKYDQSGITYDQSALAYDGGTPAPPPTPPTPVPKSPFPPLYDATPRGGGGGGPFRLVDEHLTVTASEMERRREEREKEALDQKEADRKLDEVVAALYIRFFI